MSSSAPPRVLIIDDGSSPAEVLSKLKAAGIEVETLGDIDVGASLNPFNTIRSETLRLMAQSLRDTDPDPMQPDIGVKTPISYGPHHNIRKGKARRW